MSPLALAYRPIAAASDRDTCHAGIAAGAASLSYAVGGVSSRSAVGPDRRSG